jgi:RNA recognition motif-containing protein
MTIYVGNLSYQAKEQDLNDLFSEYGEVSSVKIMKDNVSGRAKGFAFIEMENEEDAKRAIDQLNNRSFMERNLVVNEARPKTERPPRQNFDRDRNDRGGRY